MAQNTFWNQSPDSQQLDGYYDSEIEFNNLQNQQIDFQTFPEGPADGNYYLGQNVYDTSKTILDPTQGQFNDVFTPSSAQFENVEIEDEPPLLEELEIYPERIIEKTLAAMNPFRSHGLADDAEFLLKETDLAGPIAFCLALACFLFVGGGKAPFGYIYGLSVLSCLLMYCLLSLMSNRGEIFTLSGVASILGYCLLPVVVLSFFGIFVSLGHSYGIILALLAVIWSSLSSSRLFVAMSGDNGQRPLIAYPCALVYGVFALLVVF